MADKKQEIVKIPVEKVETVAVVEQPQTPVKIEESMWALDGQTIGLIIFGIVVVSAVCWKMFKKK